MGEWPKLFAPNYNASLSCPFSFKQNKVLHILQMFVFSFKYLDVKETNIITPVTQLELVQNQ